MSGGFTIEWWDGCRNIFPQIPRTPRLWQLLEMGVLVTRGRACWKCSQALQDTGICVRVADADEREEWWVCSFAFFADMMTDRFRKLLAEKFAVKDRHSKAMDATYLANTCDACGSLSGDNFVFNNYQDLGGGFSNQAHMHHPCDLYEIDPAWDSEFREYDFLAPGFSARIDPGRITRRFPSQSSYDFWRR